MTPLEHLQRGLMVRGLVPEQIVTLIDVEWNGSNAVTVVYRRSDGKVGDTLLYRENEPELSIVQSERLWHLMWMERCYGGIGSLPHPSGAPL